MLLTRLKADKLIELYGKESSFFNQKLATAYIALTDMDENFELRLMLNHLLDPKLECRMCGEHKAAVRAIYRFRGKIKKPVYSAFNTFINNYHTQETDGDRYKWAYVCSDECLEKFRTYILMFEIDKPYEDK
jgi:hypothetical protein